MMSALFKLTRPLLLLLAALTYTLGASIPAYLGRSFQPVVYALGLAGVLLAELSMALLAEVFRPHNEPLVENETPQQKEALRTNALYLSIAALSSSAFFVYLLYIDQALVASSIIFIVTSFVLVISYSIPPIRLVNRGFGELTLAAHIAYVVPSIGFLLQAQDNHRLLAVIIIPLTALALAYFIVVNFTSYLIDQKYERGTLLRRLTWERAVPLHHGLIVFAYVVFAVAPLFGFSILGTAFLTLPFALLQIILVRNLSLGAKPNWVLLTSTALAVFGLTTYFITLTFWLR